jgi:hypothetical protein
MAQIRGGYIIMEKIFRLVLAGIMAGIIMFVSVYVLFSVTGTKPIDPSLKAFFSPEVGQMKVADLGMLLLAVSIIGLILAIFYSLIEAGISANGVFKGIFFGFMVWVLNGAPLIAKLVVSGGILRASTYPWLIQGVISYILAGICIALIYKK